MLEALLATPLLWMNVPVYIALPITTSFIALFPFVFLALFLRKKGSNFWACLCLVIPVLMPIQYSFLTTIPRGFVQAHFFAPLLFIPLFYQQSKRNVTILYFGSAICLVANQSSLFLVLPVFLFVYTYHFKSTAFYLKIIFVLPIIICDYFAKYYYKIHPEKVLHGLSGLRLDGQTFVDSFTNANHFENLFPFFSSWGIVYPLFFLFLVIIARVKSMRNEFIFVLSILILLLISLAIPRVQTIYPNGGVFFSPSRLYLYLPILLIIASYLIFKKFVPKKILVYSLLVLCGITFLAKNLRIQIEVKNAINETAFPVAKNQDLITRAIKIEHLTEKYEIDLIVHANDAGWNYVFDSYAFNPLTQSKNRNNKNIISVNLNGDRRTWLYSNSIHCKQILFNGIDIDESLLEEFDHEFINSDQMIIKDNRLNTNELFARLNLNFGIKAL
ncbi:MAG: hypothetical protein KKA07_15515 [Bacteroidetes bacterium]|nr:hypothetical protein [Bacteroidota bacterium]